jgi:thiol:disulfide interchange protein
VRVSKWPLGFLILLLAGIGWSQRVDPVQWSLTLDRTSVKPGGQVGALLKATVAPGYHLYSLTTQGANPTKITLPESPVIGADYRVLQPTPVRKLDPNFQLETETYDGDVTFLIVLNVGAQAAEGDLSITAQTRYQACTETTCLLPKKKTASATIRVAADGDSKPVDVAGFESGKLTVDSKPGRSSATTTPATTTPDGLGAFLWLAATFGLASIFTPCVFPMIPIILTQFASHDTSQQKSGLWPQTLAFFFGLVGFFTLIGVGVTALVGPFGVVQLTGNPWVNLGIASIFIALGISMLGAFEITLPSGLLTKLNAAGSGGGLVGPLIMGLTFAMTAFACVGPFMGTLLVASVQGDKLRPILGMIAFAAALGFPFLLLGFFPSLLNRLPRSGVWLARVKTVMGFVILAAALKYLSNADQAWQTQWISRELFLSAWFVLFLLPGLYLLGKLRMEGIKADDVLGWGRALVGAGFVIFSVSLLPGMFGAKLGELEAFIPFPNENSIPSGGTGAKSSLPFIKDDYAAALAKAKAENKPVFVSFTGVACTNCHWMKANMLPKLAVAKKLEQFVLVELYTDRSDPVSEKNQQLQEGQFASSAIPFYAIITPDEKVLATSQGLVRDEAEYLKFLESGLTAR